MELLQLLKTNCPLEEDTSESYFEKIGTLLDISSIAAGSRIKRLLKKNNLPQGVNGVRLLIESPTVLEDTVSIDDISWRDMIPAIEQMKKLRGRNNASSHFIDVSVSTKNPICIIPFGDVHIGAIGTDYELFQKITDEIIKTPNLYIILMGDEIDLAIKLRSIAEVLTSVLTPELQIQFMKSWLNDIKHKVLFAVQGNHDARIKQFSGVDVPRNIITKVVPYSTGICHVNLQVGDVLYKIAAAHKFPGHSMWNVNHANKKYSAMQYPEGDIYLGAHTHRPGGAFDWESGKLKVYLNSATLKTHDEYAATWFSILTSPVYPCMVLHPNEKIIAPFISIKHWKALTLQETP